MTQKFEALKAFRKWFDAGFGTELLPIAPPTGTIARGSTIRPEHLGKTPAVRNRDGTWNGLGGSWSKELHPGIPELKEWGGWGASVGHQGRGYPLLDIDTDNPKAATAIEGLALEYLGVAPVRERDNSSRRLLFYKLKDRSEPIRKTRLAWKDSKGVKHAVELLGLGQQAVVEGPHPKGMMYRWRGDESPCEWGTDKLTEIDANDVERFFVELAKLVTANGGEILRGVGAAATGVLGPRKGLDDPLLWAPRPEMVVEVLAVWPNSAETLPTHDDFVAALAAIKAALGERRDEFYGDVEQWACGYEGNDGDYIRKTWDSIMDASLGWEWLSQHAPAIAAQADFDEHGNDGIRATALEKMLDRFVYASNIDRYVDLKTGELLTGRASTRATLPSRSSGARASNQPRPRSRTRGTRVRPG